MNKFAAIFGVFQQSKEMRHAAFWTNATAVGNLIGAIASLVVAFGYAKFNVTADQAQLLGGVVASVVLAWNGFMHVAANPNGGIPVRAGDPPDAQGGGSPRAQGEPGDVADIRDPGGA